MSTKVVVGMSGGVDSAVAAHLLKQQGYDVLGVFMKNWDDDDNTGQCTARQDFLDVLAVADVLGIEVEAVNFAAEYKERVFSYFLAEYQAGRTPNPDVLCNAEIKFRAFLDDAISRGAEYIATGHYVGKGEDAAGRATLLRAADTNKDQSYFLHRLTREQLDGLLLPLGEIGKEEVRALACDLGLGIHAKRESQDICFLPENDYAAWLKDRLGAEGLHPGEFVSPDGKALGAHAGIELFTVGQRKGINVGSPKPLYVLSMDAASHRVTIGGDEALWKRDLVARDCVWGPEGPPASEARAHVQIRQRHVAAPATLTPLDDGGIRVVFDAPQRAITPGQAAVFYEGDVVLGGGWIDVARAPGT